MNLIQWIKGALCWQELDTELRYTKAELRLVKQSEQEWYSRCLTAIRERDRARERITQFAGYRAPKYQGVKARAIGDVLQLFPRGFSVGPNGDICETILATSHFNGLLASRGLEGNEGYLIVRMVDTDTINVDDPTVVGVSKEGSRIIATKVDIRRKP